MAIGYIVPNNLNENDTFSKDLSSINNLTSLTNQPNIGFDIQLLSNNTKDVSILYGAQSNNEKDFIVSDNTFIINNLNKLAFSNRTKIFSGENGELELTVVESDGISQFKLKDSSDNFYNNGNYDLVRKDIVTFDNIKNLNVRRREEFNALQNIKFDGTGYFDYINRLNINEKNDDPGYLEEVEKRNVEFNFLKRFSILADKSYESNREGKVSGYLQVVNDENVDINDPNSPGLYIFYEGESKRTFSDFSSPWEIDLSENYTKTSSDKVITRELKLTNPNFENISFSNTATENVIGNFTHKLEITVNGEKYFLLCERVN